MSMWENYKQPKAGGTRKDLMRSVKQLRKKVAKDIKMFRRLGGYSFKN